jgi:HAD superfamily hydrolase (TIGR01490 family)
MSVHRSPKSRSLRSIRKDAAFYDLDGTLVALNLIHTALYLFSNLGEWSGRVRYWLNFAARVPAVYLAEKRDRYLLNIVLFESFKGLSRDRLRELGDEYCDRVLMKHLFPRALAMIEANREAGFEPVLVTGAPDFVAQPLAQRLGIRDCAANQLTYRKGRATGRLAPPVLAGDEKARWCANYAIQNQLELSRCWGYADSHYDLPFLAAMGHPVAVNPDARLTAVARSRHWPIIYFNQSDRGEGATLAGGIRTRAQSLLSRWLDGAA